jgi:hypothetical protein
LGRLSTHRCPGFGTLFSLLHKTLVVKETTFLAITLFTAFNPESRLFSYKNIKKALRL